MKHTRLVMSVMVAILAIVFTVSCKRTVPSPLYGVTFDNDAGASAATLTAQAAALSHLPHKPTVRIVIDPGTTPADYLPAANKFQPIAYTMAELVDSSSIKQYTPTQYGAHAETFVTALSRNESTADPIDLWEIGNEVNGNWTGPYAEVADKITRAHTVVKAHDKTSVLTLWENTWAPNHCGNGNNELTPQQFSSQYLSATVRAGISYVLLSWYPSLCSGLSSDNVPAATIKAEVEGLHTLYPNAKIGFGEIGLPNKTSATTLARAQAMATYYYTLGNLGLSYYVGGYFWWYGAQDLVPYTTKPMWQTIANAMQ